MPLGQHPAAGGCLQTYKRGREIQPTTVGRRQPYSPVHGNSPAMVTGIEAAGLALGIFPLVLKGVEVYMDGLDTAKDLWHWRRQLRFIYRELQVEFALFESTCERLIEEVGTDGIEGGIMTMMSGDIDCWRESGFDCKLAKHMGDHIANVFIDQVIELNNCLEEIRGKLGLKYSDFVS